MFYRLIRNLGGDIVYNHADFRAHEPQDITGFDAISGKKSFSPGNG